MNRSPHAPCTVTLRPVCHPSGAFMVYTATTGTHIIELYQVEQADGARTHGSWFLQIGVAGANLRTHSRHFTMAQGRQFAISVLNQTTGPTHAELLAGFALAEANLVTHDAGHQAHQAATEVARPVVVIACGATKLDTTAPAAELYTSAHFALMLRAARRVATQQAGRVLILSALHGLVELDTEIAPYDVKMGDPGSIAPDVLAHQVASIAPSSITTLLPLAYAAALDEAAELAGAPDLVDLFAEAPGIGYQRSVASRLLAAA